MDFTERSLVLALDTTSRGGSVAVCAGDSVRAVIAGDDSRTHGERLPGEIDRALKRSGVEARDLDLLVVASGPGAFTGLRIGLAAIQGLAMVLAKPVIGISALDALARAALPALIAGDRQLLVWMDAQRGEVFSATYATVELPARALPIEAPVVGLPQHLADAQPLGSEVVGIGDGARRFEPLLAERGVRVLPDPGPLAPVLASLGLQRAAAGLAGPPHALQPLYVRRPDAELERLRRERT